MPTLTILLILAISAISIYGFLNEDFFNDFSFNVYQIRKKKQYLRIITSAFVHVDIAHLAFNMFSLYSFAEYMEIEYSPLIIILSFVLSTIGGGIFSLIKNWNNPDYTAIGASGGVCGIIYSSILLMESSEIYVFPIPIPIPDKLYAIGFIIISYFLMKKGMDNIGHDAHIGGALTGVIFAITVIPWVLKQEYLLITGLFIPFVFIYTYDKFLEEKLKK